MGGWLICQDLWLALVVCLLFRYPNPLVAGASCLSALFAAGDQHNLCVSTCWQWLCQYRTHHGTAQ